MYTFGDECTALCSIEQYILRRLLRRISTVYSIRTSNFLLAPTSFQLRSNHSTESVYYALVGAKLERKQSKKNVKSQLSIVDRLIESSSKNWNYFSCSKFALASLQFKQNVRIYRARWYMKVWNIRLLLLQYHRRIRQDFDRNGKTSSTKEGERRSIRLVRRSVGADADRRGGPVD